MKTINQDELFENLSGFLKAKGMEFQAGSFAHRIRQGCNVLTDAINATQKTVKRAKTGVDRKLDQLRQSLHEATAPKPPPPAQPGAKNKASDKRSKAPKPAPGKPKLRRRAK